MRSDPQGNGNGQHQVVVRATAGVECRAARFGNLALEVSQLLFQGGGVRDRVCIERLRDPPTEWGRQFEALGLKPEYLPRSQRSRITATQKADLRGLVQSDLTLKAGRRERNFWMRRQGAKNRHRNG